MQEETKNWLTYSEENLEAAKVLLESELYNPCIHNFSDEKNRSCSEMNNTQRTSISYS